MKDTVALRYSGEAVESGHMDAYEAAAGMIAFADFISIAARAAYGETAKVKTEVRAFEHGSFVVQFALDFGGVMATLFSGIASPKEMYELIKQSFDAWKHLQGENPAKTTILQDGTVQVENNHGQIAVYRAETINIITHPDAASAVTRFAAKPLQSGMESVSIQHGGAPLVEARVEDAEYIGALIAREMLTENLIKMWLYLESPVFKDGNKWKFSDGASSFWADIEDQAFLNEVESGKRFGKGDRMLVEMRQRQSGTLAAIKQERTILQVIEHRPPAQQASLM